MNLTELTRLQMFLRSRFNDPALEVRARPNKADSAEVYSGDEFIGVLFRDEDDEDDYHFNMAILGIDLEDDGGTA